MQDIQGLYFSKLIYILENFIHTSHTNLPFIRLLFICTYKMIIYFFVLEVLLS